MTWERPLWDDGALAGPVVLPDVQVVAQGRPRGTLVCEVKGKTVSFRRDDILAGSQVTKVGDRGKLIIPRSVAVKLGLT